jgi:hypothetical protein
MQILLLSKGAVWMRTVTYFTKRSPASFFMEGKKAEKGKCSFTLWNSKLQKDSLRNVENTAHDVMTPRQNNIIFYVSCNYDNCIN